MWPTSNLVNKQYNSPIQSYSPEVIQETLDRKSQVLPNGAIGIDFRQMAKPPNLQNSAVLRMLQTEEENRRNGKPGFKRVEWPPVEEGRNLNKPYKQNLIQTQNQPNLIKSEGHNQRISEIDNSINSQYFEPPPTLITLRTEVPISQTSSPVYQAQPAAINPNTGSMRGDLKWPPASVKEQAEAENQARIELAKGPVCRPRRVNKDYSGFFAQHAVTNNYPGYRAPPGTQYFTPAYQH